MAARRVGGGLALLGAGGASGCWLYANQHRWRPPPLDAPLRPDASLACRLASVKRLTHDTSRFRFELPSSEHSLGLPCASHILAVDNAMVARAYTPVSDPHTKGHFDLVVKRYPNGYFSERFHRMEPGDVMDFRGPVTTLQYEPNAARSLGLIAGGTGITPMYQIIRAVLADPEDRTQLRLLYASKSRGDVLLGEELEALAARHPEQLQVRYLLERDGAGGAAAGPAATTGRVSAETIRGFLPPPTAARTALFVCGPPPMMAALCGPPQAPRGERGRLSGGLLRRMGYGRQVVPFSDDTG